MTNHIATDASATMREMYEGVSTTEDRRHEQAAYTVWERGDPYEPPCRYTWLEAKFRLVELMAKEPDKKFSIRPARWDRDRICWKYSLDNPDYVACMAVLRSRPNHPVEPYWQQQDRMTVEFVRHYRVPSECLEPADMEIPA